MTAEQKIKIIRPATGEDKIFADKDKRISDFTFDENVSNVFDDMVSRSVPFYDEIQRMVCELAADFAVPGTNIYDIGCSTGTTFEALHPKIDPSVNFVGIDNSENMLNKAREKLASIMPERKCDLVMADVNGGIAIQNASVVTMILVLQFVRPLYRDRLIKKVYEGMNENGCLLLVEKLTSSHTILNRLFIEHYYDYKRRNGYSDTEIAKKREALENIMIPYRPEENIEMLTGAGFRHVEDFFRWYNFTAYVAVK
ncbi:MAG: carboxy-S-adenosyl-L-methionine synthase CmoA [Alphaproteobacteria bacterium CG_4_9_14_3_um_filter_47_13]|nr:MAG: carboxy-S-adenosyl-L-methionine synthase CmoA [Alphaproteobacteria bacterium CG_4_9_14_3_um_filter_47_13]